MNLEIRKYVILMAITLSIQAIAYSVFPIESSLIDLFESEAGFGEALSDYIAHATLSMFAYLLPGIASAYWIASVKSVRVTPKIAWVIVALATEYFILAFYIAAKIRSNSVGTDDQF